MPNQENYIILINFDKLIYWSYCSFLTVMTYLNFLSMLTKQGNSNIYYATKASRESIYYTSTQSKYHPAMNK